MVCCAFLDVAAVLTAVTVIVYLYFKYSYQYWAKQGVPYLKPSFPYGNCAENIKGRIHIGKMMDEWYTIMKAKGERHMGFYFLVSPTYMPIDINIIKSIMVSDFQHFYDRGMYSNEESDPLSAHLFSLNGLRWKNLRNKLSPTFTSGKLKKMFQTLVDCSENLKNCLNEPISKGEPVDIRFVLAQYTTDVIGSCAFGIDCNSFQDPNNEFARIGKKAFQQGHWERIQMFFAFNFPKLAKVLKLKLFNKEVEAFYMNMVRDTIEYRQKNNVVRNDFMQLLMQLMNQGAVENDEGHIDEKDTGTTLSFNEVVAQAFLFFIAGFETSSAAMTFSLYELALNTDVQDKVREEIINVLKKHDGKITYESIMEMHYLDQVFNESLRMHSPATMLQRECTKEYQVPDTNYVMKKGVKVWIPVNALHYDPEYYPEPEKFDPERFTEENKATRPYYSFIPFGEGPRICIGIRFAIMQTKVGLVRLLKNYKFSLNSKTMQPLKLNPTAFVATVIGGIWLDVERCTN